MMCAVLEENCGVYIQIRNYIHEFSRKYMTPDIIRVSQKVFDKLEDEKGMYLKPSLNPGLNKFDNISLLLDKNLKGLEIRIETTCCYPQNLSYKFATYDVWENKLPKLPERYIINQNATILFWGDGTKTIVKKSKDDKYDKEKAFLIAYFHKHCGTSRNQANKYLKELKEENK